MLKKKACFLSNEAAKNCEELFQHILQCHTQAGL